MVEKFLLVGLKANLPETRDPNKLYFCSDTRELFKGNDLYTDAVRIVDALPADMAQGVLYILPSGEVKSFNGTDVITVAKPYVASTAGTLSAANTDDQVPTAKVVYDSIVEAIGAVVDGGELVNNVISTKAGTITVAKGAYTQLTGEAVFSEGTNYFTKVGESYVVDQTVTAENFAGKVEAGLFVSSDETDVALKGVVVNPSYDATTRTITLPYADGAESLVIGLGKDIFVDSTAENKYNAETGKIEIFLNDGNEETGATKLEIPASELVDIYTGAVSADGSATVAVSEDNKITASVNVSAEAGNGLSKKADGLFVDTTSAADFKAFKDSVDASLDDIDSQLNGEEIVLKEAGVATDVTYVFDAKDTVVVDSVETEVADQSALDTIVADENVSDVVVMVDGTEDRIAANAAAVAQAQAGVDANAEAIAANAEAIATLEAKNDVHVDATADNKFNAETGKVELFLNDSSEGYETIERISGEGSICFKILESATFDQSIDGKFVDLSDLDNDQLNVTEDNFAEKVAEGLYLRVQNNSMLWNSADEFTSAFAKLYPGKTLYILNNTTGEYEDFTNSNYSKIAQVNDTHTLVLGGSSESTKVEVDMSGLTSQVAANTEAIASNKTEAKNYADGLNTAMDARVTVVEEKTQANEDAIAANAEAATQAIAQVQAGVDTNAEAIEALEAKKDLRLDETADNKYNAETGKIELFLNDDGIFEIKLGIVNPEGAGYSAYKIINPNAQYMSSNSDFNYCDEELNDITSEVTADNFAEKVEKGLWVKNKTSNINATLTYAFGDISSLPDNLYYQNTDGEVVLVSTLPNFYATTLMNIMGQFTETVHLRSGEEKEPTKIEVDMSELTSQVAANIEANETFVDPTADNKYNAETDKVELFLNDGEVEYEAMTLWTVDDVTNSYSFYFKVVDIPYSTISSRIASDNLFKLYDSSLNDITDQVSEDNFDEKVAEGLYYSDGLMTGGESMRSSLIAYNNPEKKYYYINTNEEYVQIDGSKLAAEYNSASPENRLCIGKTFCEQINIPATKVEVDMSQLTNIINSNNQSNTESIEALEEAVQWGTF